MLGAAVPRGWEAQARQYSRVSQALQGSAEGCNCCYRTLENLSTHRSEKSMFRIAVLCYATEYAPQSEAGITAWICEISGSLTFVCVFFIH